MKVHLALFNRMGAMRIAFYFKFIGYEVNCNRWILLVSQITINLWSSKITNNEFN